MRRERSHAITGAFALVLLGVFAVCSAMLALFGAQAYRSVVAHSQERGARRTLTAMVRNAVRASDAEGALSVETLDGVQVLCFTSAVDGEEYIRYLYVYDGAAARAVHFRPAAFRSRGGRRSVRGAGHVGFARGRCAGRGTGG